MKKSLLSIFLIFILMFSVLSLPASAYKLSGFEVRAEGVMLVSIDTGDILYSKNTDKRFYPASLTKIMTALILLENTPDLDGEILTVSYNAIHALDGTGSSMGGLMEGEQITARQALYYLLMRSANECANVIAEHYAGTIYDFVGKMNLRAQELSMTGTHFVNAHGLHDSEHYTTVQDLYILMKEVMKYPEFMEVTSATRFQMPATNKQAARTISTTVFLQDKHNVGSPKYYYPYAAGVKTGYTDEAGRCLISTASKGGYNYLCILMNSTVYNESGAMVRYEFEDSQQLYDWAFDNFEYKTVVDQSSPVAEAKVELCWESDHVSLLLEGGLSAILPKEADSSTVQIKPTVYKDSFDAPIKKGEVLGTAEIVYAGESLGTINLVASETLEANFFLRIGRYLKQAFTSTVFKLLVASAVIAILVFILIVVLMNRKRRRRRRRYYHNTRRR